MSDPAPPARQLPGRVLWPTWEAYLTTWVRGHEVQYVAARRRAARAASAGDAAGAGMFDRLADMEGALEQVYRDALDDLRNRGDLTDGDR